MTMKHAAGTRAKIITPFDGNIMIGAEGTIIGVGFSRYTLALDSDPSYACYPTEDDIEAIKKPLHSAMEQYGRILLPLLHGSHDAPKMVYYSSTTGSVYMMDKMMNTDQCLDICVVKMLWDRELQDRNPNTVATEVFRLKQPSNMSDVLKAFNAFLIAHVNGKDYSDLLWQGD